VIVDKSEDTDFRALQDEVNQKKSEQENVEGMKEKEEADFAGKLMDIAYRIKTSVMTIGCCDMRSSRIFTDYRLSQKRSISA